MEIFNLNDIPAERHLDVGGKARGLCLMAQAGLAIAPGFVLTDIATDADLDEAAAYFIASGMSAVAVRSSATAEDGADFSNAGQYKTFLNITTVEALKQAVVGCLASLESVEAESYAAFFNQAESAEMAVVVQQMVDSAKAGVCFTVDPNDAKRATLLVEAVEGVGESLVSGFATAVQYTIDRSTQALLGASSESELLSANELKAITTEALQASAFFDMPLDLEWAVSKAGELFWLQARPITTLDEADIHELDPKWDFKGQITTTCNISEMMPGAVTPLTLSTSVYGIDWGLRMMLIKSGVFANLDEAPAGEAVFSIGNHLFMNLTFIGQLGEKVIGCTNQGIEMSICGKEAVHNDEYPTQTLKVNKVVGLINFAHYLHFTLSRNSALRKLKKMAKNYRFVDQPTIEKQFRALDKAKQNINLVLYYHYKTSSHSGTMSNALSMALEADIPRDEVRLIIAQALEHIDNIESVDVLRSLRTIARALIAEDSDCESLSNDEILAYLKQSKGAARDSYLAFMQKHGHRALLEAEMSSLGWADDEQGFMNYLRTVLASKGVEPTTDSSGYSPYRDIDARYTGAKRAIFRYLIDQSRKGVVNREASKSAIIKVINEIKKGYRRLAAMLHEARALPDEALIFFLQHDEINELVKTRDATLVKLALQRKRAYEEQKRLTFDDIYYGYPEPQVRAFINGEPGMELQGTPLSKGFTEGRARVVRSIDDAAALQKGEIMVAAFTDIGWSPYYCLIEGLITEIGSVLSHGAVVAREYRLPLVSNVKGATDIIRTGDRIQINGERGLIKILDNA